MFMKLGGQSGGMAEAMGAPVLDRSAPYRCDDCRVPCDVFPGKLGALCDLRMWLVPVDPLEVELEMASNPDSVIIRPDLSRTTAMED